MKKIFILSLVVFFAGCTTTRVTMYRDVPAEINVSKFNAVTINSVTGAYSDKLSSALKNEFFNSKYFKLVSNKANPNNSIFSIDAEVIDKNFSQDQQSGDGVCWQNGKKYNCTLYTTTAEWSMTVLFRFTDNQTGEVFDQTRIRKTARDKEDSLVDFNSADGYKKLVKKVAAKLSNSLQPHKESVHVKLFDDSDNPDLEKGVKFAKKGDWETAAKYFEKAINVSEEKGLKGKAVSRAYYDYGVALGYGGIDYDAALKNIKHAKDLYESDDYLREYAMVTKFKKDHEKLLTQGYTTSKK